MDKKEVFVDELSAFEEAEKITTKKADKVVGAKASALKFFQSPKGKKSDDIVLIQGKESLETSGESPFAVLNYARGEIVQGISLNGYNEANNEPQKHFVPTWHEVEGESTQEKSERIDDKKLQSAIINTHQQTKEYSKENFVPTWHEVKNTENEAVSTAVQEVFVDERESSFSQIDTRMDFVDESILEDFVSDNPLDESDPYIYFDYDKDNSEKVNHDKMALRQVRTEAGGGATFQAEYTKKGKLVSKIKLDEKRDVPLVRLTEFERDMQLFQDVKSDEESSDVSKVDSVVEAAIYYSIDKTDAIRSQYREIRKEAEKEEKQLKKEIKEEELLRRRQEAEVKKYFPESVAEFCDDSNGFSNIVDMSFKNEQEYIDSYFSNDGACEEKEKKVEEIQSDSFQSESTEDNEFKQNDNQSQSSTKEKEERREMTKEEKLEQAKSKKKAAKKSENSAIIKMARRTAVGIFIKTKKAAQDEAENMNFQSSGDLVKDGTSGLLQSVLDLIKQAVSKTVMMATASIGKFLAGLLGPVFLVIVGVLLAGVMLINVVGSVAITIASFQSDEGIEYDLDVEGDGMAYASLSAEQIESIIESLYVTYPDMSYTQETVLRYSLSKVGCAYDQNYHSSLTVDIFDCSSLAYRSYLQGGIDISYQNLYTAAYECYALEEQGKIVGDDLQPGDLIFYGGANNNRYLGIYHVAIYIGKIDGVDKMVEARGKDYGVLYCDV